MTLRMRQHERVSEVITATGSGNLASASVASDGARLFSAVDGGLDFLCYVTIEHDNGTEWETSLVRYDESSNEWERLQCVASSNSNAFVNFSAGNKTIYLVSPADHGRDLDMFGAGTTDVTISSPTTLAVETWYGDLTLQSTLYTATYYVAVAGVLDMTHASARLKPFSSNGDGGLGGNASGSTGGSAGTGAAAVTAQDWSVGTAGANGSAGANANAAPGSGQSSSGSFGAGAGGNGGKGGNARTTGGSGGTGTTPGGSLRPVVSTRPIDYRRYMYDATSARLGGGTGGGGGGAGSDNGTSNAGGGGGGGGRGGAMMAVFASVLRTGGSTAAGAIETEAGQGGQGGNGAGTGAGGGGGGGGGGGAAVVIVGARIGSAVTNLVRSKGGNGGAAGSGGTAPVAGSGGQGGPVRAINLHTGTVVEAGPTAASGSTGGTSSVTF